MTELGDKLSEDEKKDITAAIDDLKAQLAAKDVEKIKASQEELQKKVYAMSEKLYAAAQEAAGQQGEGAPNADGAKPEGDNVYEADYNEVKDDQDKK